MGLRHQLPVYSPLSLGALLRASGELIRTKRDPRRSLLQSLLNRTQATAGVLTDSGSSALRLALEGPSREDRGLVALPAFSCYDVATAAVGAGVSVRFYDLDPTTLSPDRESLEAALKAGATRVVVAPLFGFPVDWEGIRRLTDHHGARVIEDAAQAHGSTFMGRPGGTHGDLVVLSFGRGKGWTGGGGGALMVRTPQGGERWLPRGLDAKRGGVGELGHLVLTTAVWALGRPGVYGAPRAFPGLELGETHYREPRQVGTMTRTSASLLLQTEGMARIEAKVRQGAAAEYQNGLSREPATSHGMEMMSCVNGGTSGFLRFPLLLPRLNGRAIEVGRDLRRLGVERSYPKTLDQLAPLAPFAGPAGGRGYPGSMKLAAQLVTLPTHSHTTARERSEIVSRILKETEAAG